MTKTGIGFGEIAASMMQADAITTHGLRSRERASMEAALRATGANDSLRFRTGMNSGLVRARGHELI